ncbi:MAG: hypothetical protein M3462_14375 [Chloroflexota bacterium]|nr:hypothetical protein [Chloroflexota bacterium]
MRRITVVTSTLLLALALSLSSALAANPHYMDGPNFTVDTVNNTVNATGDIAGLGNENIDVELIADYTAAIECTNKGSHYVPAQDVEGSTSGVQTDIEPKNGRATFDVTTDPATVTGTPRQVGCPNNNWSYTADITFVSATLNVYQGNKLVLSDTFPL